MKLKITVLSLCLIVLAHFTNAQQEAPASTSSTTTSTSSYGLPKKKDFDQWSIGISAGLNWFQGDLQGDANNNSGIMKNLKNPVFGVKIGYQMSHSVQVNARFNMTKFTGEKEGDAIQFRWENPTSGKAYIALNPSFEAPEYQGTLNLNYTLGNISFVQRNKKLHLFGELGVGFFSVSPKLKGTLTNVPATGTPGVDFPPTGTNVVLNEASNTTEGMIPISLGVKYQVKRVDIGLMFTYHKTLTDKVDLINKEFSEYDNYSFINLGINYTLGKKHQMMEWVNPMEVVYNDMAELKDKMDMLSGDKDKDGVSDMFDKDNSTAEGSKVYGDGTSVDTDGDGIPDSKDSDPFTGKGAKVDANGVEVDSDGDGVPDSRDLEPNTGKGSLVNFQGIAIDKNLEAKGVASGSSGSGWLPPVFFDLNSSAINGAQRDRALIVAKVLMTNANLRLNIVGNCDQTAGEDYNQKLGQKRADAVKDHLVKHYGIDASRLTTSSKGKKEVLAKNLNSMNRRVDFEVTK